MTNRKICSCLIIISVAISLYFQLQQLSAPLLDIHSFRQTQTAISVFWFSIQGVDLQYLTPVFGWPWSVPFEFPIYQILVYLFSSVFSNLSIDMAGRLVSMFFYYGMFFPLYRILKQFELEDEAITIVFIVVLFMPVFMFWSRTFMIESTALFFSLMFISLVLSYEKDKGNINGKLALVLAFSILSILTKVTTYAVSLIFLFYYVIFYYETSQEVIKKRFIVAGIVILTIFFGKYWASYADGIKLLNPISETLMSDKLFDWIFGTVGQRFELSSYHKVFGTWGFLIRNSGPLILVLLLLPAMFFVNSIHKKLLIIGLLTFMTSYMVFFNLYQVHNYYWYANSIFLAISVGILYINIAHYFRVRIASSFIAIFVIITGLIYYSNSWYYKKQTEDTERYYVLEISNLIKKHTEITDYVYINGFSWSSEVPYYSQRKAFMAQQSGAMDIDSLKFASLYEKSMKEDGGRVTALVLCGKNIDEGKRIEYFNLEPTFMIKVSDCRVIIE